MESTLTLPPSAILSSSVVTFLNGRFNDQQDLEQASAIVSELQSQCVDLDQSLTAINSRIQSSLLAYASFSDRIQSLVTDTTSKLTDLGSLTSASSSFSDGGVKEQVLAEELPALAKEVSRVEIVRAYADTALKLDVLVGDIEDVVAFVMNRNLKRPAPQTSDQEMCTHAIEALGKTEDVLTYITKKRSQWTRLVSAVDDRVDRALATLRPQQIADHRMLLTSLGWPPPLSSLTSQILDTEKSSEASNPLFTMHGDLKRKYCENFRALCRLQELQIRRKGRQLEGHNREVALHQPLWAVEELVNPISIACQRHFTKWTDKPEFIFALVYKITRDYVDTMDELLQPLVDEARLVGYSCREEWISAMVTSLSTYLAKEVFTAYISQQEDENVSGILSQARMSWLHLVDLMISFDKRVLSLATHSGVLMSIQEDRNLQKISSLSVFCDKPDWLDFWAEIELSDTLEKLKAEAEDERNWIVKVQGAALLSGPENYKSPLVSSSFLKHLSIVIDRCRSLPTISLRYRFLRLIGAPIIHKFLDCVLFRCQEAEGMTALTDDDGLIKVANSINAVHYFESVVKEWCEDVFFVEMGYDQNDPGTIGTEGYVDTSLGGIFEEEIRKLEYFRKEWVEKVSVVLLRGFEARCREYLKNKRQWQDRMEEGWPVSKNLVESLDYLQAKMAVVEENMNSIDFVSVWRSLASGIDRALFNGVFTSNVKFYDSGVESLGRDMEVVFGVFEAWCIRAEGFFPKMSEGLKLLKKKKKEEKGDEKWMKEKGIRHLGMAEAERILKSRVFGS
ncbi:RINT1-like protein MAG2 [Linum perenne]